MTAYSIEGSVLDPHLAIHVIIDMIPHWFEAKEGPLAVPLPFAPALANCFSHVPISEMMEKFLEEVDRSLPDLAKRCVGFSESLWSQGSLWKGGGVPPIPEMRQHH